MFDLSFSLRNVITALVLCLVLALAMSGTAQASEGQPVQASESSRQPEPIFGSDGKEIAGGLVEEDGRIHVYRTGHLELATGQLTVKYHHMFIGERIVAVAGSGCLLERTVLLNTQSSFSDVANGMDFELDVPNIDVEIQPITCPV